MPGRRRSDPEQRVGAVVRARRGTADDYRVEITYGDKTVVASDAAENLPQVFWSAYEAVRKLHEGL